jgi:murein L,D-transpeptidase YafK
MYRDDSQKQLKLQDEVTSILVRKDIRRLYLMHDHHIIKGYNIALGRNPAGHKERRGDHKTPEGIYKISLKNAHSGYHKALKISYPNSKDRARAHKKGLDPGNDVFLHGLSNDPKRKKELLAGEHPVINWTWGCIAVTDHEIDEIFRVVPVGTPIEICNK